MHVYDSLEFKFEFRFQVGSVMICLELLLTEVALESATAIRCCIANLHTNTSHLQVLSSSFKVVLRSLESEYHSGWWLAVHQ